jgi:hypothetical protein
MDKIEFRAHMEPWFAGIDIRIRQNGSAMALPVSFKEMEPHSFSEPALRVSGDAAQQLMDELWRCGIRPTEGSGSAGSLAATQRHLDDMRALISHSIGAKLP